MKSTTLDYKLLYDKIYGCWIGKTLGGTIGAPYEGIKMAMKLEYKPEMLDVMLPNDDLDLQILWLDVVEKKGLDFTSKDLLQFFVDRCDYSPGEYAVMRKNYIKGIYPPYSGKFCNDYYADGMGSPIRSEIWACLFPCNPDLAAEISVKDAQLDHKQASIDGERFFAALEAAAFYENDLDELIKIGLKYVTPGSKMENVIKDTVCWSKKIKSTAVVRNKILAKYGHPDCTNVFQNIGIILLSLYHGENDFIKTNMIAINAGFDTDCTCATASSILGLINGSDYFTEYADIQNLKYVLGVRLDREDTSIVGLTNEVIRLTCQFAGRENPAVKIKNVPEFEAYCFEKEMCTVDYEYDGLPVISFYTDKKVKVKISNHSDKVHTVNYTLTPDEGIVCDNREGVLTLLPGKEATLSVTVSVQPDAKILMEKNLIKLTLTKNGKTFLEDVFGVSGSAVYKVIGPFWKTNPALTTEQILSQPYFNYLAGKDQGDTYDNIRNFHVNFVVDENLGREAESVLFDSYCVNTYSEDYEVFPVSLPEDSFRLSDIVGLQGGYVVYLTRLLYSPEDIECNIQVGRSDGITLWLNDEKLLEYSQPDFFTSENSHLAGVKLHKGCNKLVLRLERRSMDAKYSLIFSKEPSCAEHIVSLGSVAPSAFSDFIS